MLYNCENTTYSSCVKYTGKTYDSDCIDACQFSSLDDVIYSIMEKVCTISQTCKVKVSSTDECCGYLFNKITSADYSVTIEKITTVVDGVSCETIDLSAAAVIQPLLYNNRATVVGTTTTSNLYEYIMPAGTLADGEMLELEGSGNNTNGTTSSSWKFTFGGQNVPLSALVLDGETTDSIVIKINITRISATSIKYSLWAMGTVSYFTAFYAAAPITVASMDANATTIRFVGIEASPYATGLGMSVKLFKK